MTKIDYILVCLMEECAEVQKNCTKSLRFGIYDRGPKKDKDNISLLAEELTDVRACVLLLEKELGIKLDTDTGIQAKINKISLYSGLSVEAKRLHTVF